MRRRGQSLSSHGAEPGALGGKSPVDGRATDLERVSDDVDRDAVLLHRRDEPAGGATVAGQCADELDVVSRDELDVADLLGDRAEAGERAGGGKRSPKT